MKGAWILSVGDEVLHGQTVNTSAATLGRMLLPVGIEIEKVVVVGDNWEAIQQETIAFLQSKATILFTTGGLGPTHDDLTKEAVSDALGLKLVYYKEIEEWIRFYFKNNPPVSNIKQCYFPENAVLLPNKRGSAYGAICSKKDKEIVFLVGPPHELEPMILDHLLPYYQKKTNNARLMKEYMVLGIGESKAEDLLQEVYSKHPTISIAPYASLGKIRYQVIGSKRDRVAFDMAITDFENTLSTHIVSSEGFDVTYEVFRALKEQKKTIAFAESCTGGTLASRLLLYSGASSVLSESVITYSNVSKQQILGVNSKTMKQYGVASNETAKEMVEGLSKISGASICVATTGVLGPNLIPNEKANVGSVWVAIKKDNEVIVESNEFLGDRMLVLERSVLWIYYRLYQLLKQKNR